MTAGGPKESLHSCLRDARAAVLWKLEGLPEYDARRPLTAHGTNLLGLIKHLAGCEIGYFGYVFERPFPHPPTWLAESTDPTIDGQSGLRADYDGLPRAESDYWVRLRGRIEDAARDAENLGSTRDWSSSP